MQHSIKLINNGKEEQIFFNSRNDLKKDFNKSKLLAHYGIKNSIRCLCDEMKELYLYIKLNGTIAVYPKSEEHNEDCVFFSKRKEFIDEETGEYKTTIFKELKSIYKAKGSNENSEEKCQRLTFYDFCREAISSGALEAFKYDYNKFNKIYNISFNQFCFSYYNVLNSLKLKGKETVISFFKNNEEYKFEYGILNDDLMVLISSGNDEDIKIINLDEIKYNYKDKKWNTVNKQAKITHRRLRLSKKLVQIWNNLIEPPFFYTAVYHNDVIIRFHLMPIFLNERNIVFVESNYERNYAKKLIEEKKVFIKPISNDEVYKIDPKVINQKCTFVPEIIYHPDFLEFTENKMIITEVSGFTNKDYKKHLDKKMRYYLKYIENKEFLFDYKCINGNTLEELEYEFMWNGEEIVEKGKYQGKKWSQIYDDTLNWYVENKEGYFKECALKEIDRRKN